MNSNCCSTPKLIRVIGCSAALVLVVLGLAACGGRRPEQGRRHAAMGPGGGEPEVGPMEAEALFFDGQVRAEVLLAHAGVKWARGGESETGAEGERGGHGGFRGGFGGGRGFRGGRHREGGEYSEGGEGAGGEMAESKSVPRMHAVNQRPLELRLRLTNLGKQPIAVEVPDFDSVLGDFAVQPDAIVVAPGKSVEAEPMVSRMGVALPEIPLTVSLQVGKKTEQHVLTLHPIHSVAPRSRTAAPHAATASP